MKNQCINIHAESLDLTNKSDYVKYEKHDFIIGADVIYDNDITDAIMDFLEHILNQKHGKNNLHFLFSIEKRYIFTVDDLDTIAPSYEYFIAKLDDLVKNSNFETHWTFELMEYSSSDVKQYFCYERSKDLFIISINAHAK